MLSLKLTADSWPQFEPSGSLRLLQHKHNTRKAILCGVVTSIPTCHAGG